MNAFTPAPTRISYCKDVVKSIIADLEVADCAQDLIAVRLNDNYADLEQPVKTLRRQIRAFTGLGGGLVVVLSAIAALGLIQGGRGPGVAGIGLFVGTLASLVAVWRLRSRASAELWLRTPVAKLGLATELLWLAYRHPSVRTYLDAALRLYDAPRGLDVLLARQLAKHEYCGLKPEMIERAAMRDLMDLPYLDDQDALDDA